MIAGAGVPASVRSEGGGEEVADGVAEGAEEEERPAGVRGRRWRVLEVRGSAVPNVAFVLMSRFLSSSSSSLSS